MAGDIERTGVSDDGSVEAPARRHRARRWAAGAAAAVLGVLAVTGGLRQCGEDAVEHSTLGTFEVLPDPLPAGRPGELIREETLLGAPNGSHAWRVLYHSTDVHGQDIGVSGVVVVPDGPAPGRVAGGVVGPPDHGRGRALPRRPSRRTPSP